MSTYDFWYHGDLWCHFSQQLLHDMSSNMVTCCENLKNRADKMVRSFYRLATKTPTTIIVDFWSIAVKWFCSTHLIWWLFFMALYIFSSSSLSHQRVKNSKWIFGSRPTSMKIIFSYLCGRLLCFLKRWRMVGETSYKERPPIQRQLLACRSDGEEAIIRRSSNGRASGELEFQISEQEGGSLHVFTYPSLAMRWFSLTLNLCWTAVTIDLMYATFALLAWLFVRMVPLFE